ncbi:MAG: hypothetical protein AB7V00_02325 [Bacilli bacterium]
MDVKEAFLDSEKLRIQSFLKEFDLDLDKDITETFYYEENNDIIATVSLSKHIIKCLAVSEGYQGEQLALKMVNEAISYLHSKQEHFFQVFTKRTYRDLFLSMGMRLIVESKNVSILESSSYPITSYLSDLKKQLSLESNDNGAIVVNCNPMTLGHLYLIEQAAKQHHNLLLFVLQENRSDFTTEERMALVKLGISHLPNVIALPSSPYLVSNLTFPSYFLKEDNDRNNEYAYLDALIFKNYFMPLLNIKHRYIGTETHPIMVTYNKNLKLVLGDSITEIKRIDLDGEPISASKVRKLMQTKQLDEALRLVPENTRMLLSKIYNERFK